MILLRLNRKRDEAPIVAETSLVTTQDISSLRINIVRRITLTKCGYTGPQDFYKKNRRSGGMSNNSNIRRIKPFPSDAYNPISHFMNC
ncbi:hypothetical protein TNCV_4446211 [Trichonephila clavipes]|nr:hypothetical protein TNCV_4446211 [Trichonephila clavipes]